MANINDILNDFLRNNDFECTAEYKADERNFYNYAKSYICIGEKDDECEESMQAFEDFCYELGLEVSVNVRVLSFMHELGHHETLDILTREERVHSDRQEAVASIIGSDYLYFTSPREQIATQWAVDYINNNPKLMCEFSKNICECLNT